MEPRLKQGRLNLRLDDELLQGMKSYAFKRRTTVTFLVEQFFLRLIDEEKKAKKSAEAEQI